MPQFDPSFWSTQIIWLLICLVAFYYLAKRLAIPRISEVLEHREFRINESLRKAEHLKEQAEEAVAAYEKLMTQARADAHEELTRVRAQAADDAHDQHTALGAKLSQMIAGAESRIAASRNEAVASVRDMAGEIVGVTIDRLIGDKLSETEIAASVDKVMKGTR